MSYRFIPLEQRMLFDASIAAVVAHAVTSAGHVDASIGDHHGVTAISSSDSHTVQADGAARSASSTAPVQVLVISSEVQDASLLASAANANTNVVLYNAQDTTLQQLVKDIEKVLGGKKADRIAFADEGGAGEFQLTQKTMVSEQTLTSDTALRSFWSEVGSLVKNNGHVDFLSCDLTQDGTGTLNLLDTLMEGSSKSHVINVAGSTDATGNPTSGGNWILETGGVNAEALYFNAKTLSGWQGDLQTFTVTNTADSGTGSLRAAILAADASTAASTINFDIAGKGLEIINLATALPTISSDVTIDGTTQPGYTAANPLIEVNGAALTGNTIGFDFVAGSAGASVKGVLIDGFTKATETSTTTVQAAAVHANVAVVTNVIVAPSADISAAMAIPSAPAFINAGGIENFTVTFNDLGPSASQGFSAVLSGDLTGLVAHSLPNGVTFNATTNTITVSSLAVSSPLVLNFSGVIPSGLASTTATEMVAITTEAPSDPNLANNTASISEAVNHAPTNIQLNPAAVVEFPANGTVVGTLSDTDPDAGDTAAYKLVNSYGGAYAIQGNQVVVANGALISYVTAQQDPIQVQVTDKGGLTYTKTIDIQVQDQPPQAVSDTYSVLENQALSVSAANGVLANDLIPDGTAHATAVLVSGPSDGSLTLNADGSMQYTPTQYFSGTDSFTYKVVENGVLSSNVVTDTINVVHVNQAPSFELTSSTIKVTANSGTDTVASFATHINQGPGDTGQTLNFIVVNNNNSLFSTQPTIDSSGNLTFALAAFKSGTATVSVQLMDNGGTANGGVNVSTIETFTIVVAPPPPSIIYVDQRDCGPANGLTWQTAFNNLDQALNLAAQETAAGATGVQIWMAAGTYSPHEIYAPNGVAGGAAGTSGYCGSVQDTFNLVNGVNIYGGFAGNETAISQRPTNGCDVTYLNGAGDWHVLTAGNDLTNAGITVTLDGLTVVNGDATGPSASGNDSGGGLRVIGNSNITLNDVNFSNDRACGNGGAISQSGGTLTITSGLYVNDQASESGGAIIVQNTALSITGANFQCDIAGQSGGAIFDNNSSGTISQSTFNNDHAQNGGAILAINVPNLNITSSTFTGDQTNCSTGSTSGYGGAIDSIGSTLTLSGDTFTGNSSWANGGAIQNGGFLCSVLNLTNCCFSNDSGVNGGAICNGGLLAASLDHCVANLVGCQISSCHSSGNGGGVINYNACNLATNACVFNLDTCNNLGGAIASIGTNAVQAILTSCNSIFTNDNAFQKSGCAVFSSSCTLQNIGNVFNFDNLFCSQPASQQPSQSSSGGLISGLGNLLSGLLNWL